MAESNEVQSVTLPSNGWIVSLGSRTPSAETTAGVVMGVVTAVVGVTMEVSVAGVMTVPPVGAVGAGVVTSGSVVEAVVVGAVVAGAVVAGADVTTTGA